MDIVFDINNTQMAKHDMFGPLKPSMWTISHHEHVFFLDTTALN